MTQGLRTFLTFQGGVATAALDLYREVFDDFELIEIDHYGPGEVGPEGTVKVAKFRLAGSDFSCADSPVTSCMGVHPCGVTLDRLRRRQRAPATLRSAQRWGHGVHATRRLRVQHPFRLGR